MDNYTTEHLENKLMKELKAEYVRAIDESDGCGAKFHVTVVSEEFKGKTLLQKHRMVNTALAEELKAIHAFSQESFTPEEWQKRHC